MTAGAVAPVGKEVVGIDELGTANGAFELLAGGVLGAGANVGAALALSQLEQLGATPNLWWVTDCWFRNLAY